jgi:prephenate dehydratase
MALNNNRKVTVAFQGLPTAYGQQAAQEYFSSDIETLPVRFFKDVISLVKESRADAGIIPIENSTTGSLRNNYRIITENTDICIMGEISYRIRHCLIGLKEANIQDIDKVYSLPIALEQCDNFLRENPNMTPQPYYDTAGAVKFVKKLSKKENAAIASRQTAHYFDMKILEENIERNNKNLTRFFIIGRSGSIEPEEIGANKITVSFSLPDKSGVLKIIIDIIVGYGLNLKKIESIPIIDKPWNYKFVLDVCIDTMKKSKYNNFIKNMKENTIDLHIIGLYKNNC